MIAAVTKQRFQRVSHSLMRDINQETMEIGRKFPLAVLSIIAYFYLPLAFALGMWGDHLVTLQDVMQGQMYLVPVLVEMYNLSLQHQE